MQTWENVLNSLSRNSGGRDFSAGLADAGGARDFSGGLDDGSSRVADDEEQQIGGTDDSGYARPNTKAGQAARSRGWKFNSPTMQNQGNATGWGNVLGTGLAGVLNHYFGKD